MKMACRLWAQRSVAWLVLPLVLVGAVAAWIAFDPGFRRERQIANLSTDAPKDEFERRVHDYLMAHLDVIMQSVNQLEARQRHLRLLSRSIDDRRVPSTPPGDRIGSTFDSHEPTVRSEHRDCPRSARSSCSTDRRFWAVRRGELVR